MLSQQPAVTGDPMANTHSVPQRRDYSGESRIFPFRVNTLRYIIDIMRSALSPRQQRPFTGCWPRRCALIVCNIALLQPCVALADELAERITATTTSDGQLGSVVVRIQRAIANGDATTLQSLATPPDTRYAPKARSTNTAYVATNRDATGLIRVVDDGTHTLLEFVDLDLARPAVAATGGASLPARRNGNYLVLDGVYRDLVVYAYGNVSRIKSIGPIPAPLPKDPWGQGIAYATETTQPVAAPPSPQPATTAVAARSSIAHAHAHASVSGTANTPPPAANPGVVEVDASAKPPSNASPKDAVFPTRAPEPPPQEAVAAADAPLAPLAAPSSAAVLADIALPALPEPPTLPAIERADTALVPAVPLDVLSSDAVLANIAPLTAPPRLTFDAAAGPSVRSVIEAWAVQADWDVKWLAPIDYPVPAPLSFDGDFLDAVRYALSMYARQDRPLTSDAYTHQTLVVVKEAR